MSKINIAIILLIVLLGIGTLVYSQIEGWSLLDSLYFSVATVTTVGYGDFHPTKNITKVFTMGYILFGFGVLLFILTNLVTKFMEKEEKKIERLEKKIIELEKQSNN